MMAMPNEEPDRKAQWSSKLESFIVLLGYSIGLPETWRLPFLVYRNGGGAFLIPYGILILLCGFPLYFLELALSQYSGYGPWKIWNICPILRGLGLSVAAINILTVHCDTIVQCWSIEYIINSFSEVLPWTTCDNVWNTVACTTTHLTHASNSTLFFPNSSWSDNRSSRGSNTSMIQSAVYETESNTSLQVSAVEEFWKYKVLRMSSGIGDIGDINGMYLLYMTVIKIIVICAIVRSVKYLGKVMVVTALFPIVLITTIWIRALTLPGSLEGMKYFVNPDFSKLLNVQIWIEAAFMAFNTLGPGWGGLMMIGCHNKFNFNCLRAALISSMAVLVLGLLNGLVVFATAGVMAHEVNVPVDSVITSGDIMTGATCGAGYAHSSGIPDLAFGFCEGGFSIGFIAYPKALSYFPLPQVWCVIFYLVLILPGIDALSVMMEPFLLVLEEMFPRQLAKRRLPLLIGVSSLTFLIGIIFATQAGVYYFILGIWFVGTWNVVLICFIEAVVFGWVYGGFRLDRDVRMMLGRPMPGLIRISLSIVMPVFLISLLAISVFTYRAPSFGNYEYPEYASVIGWLITLSTLSPGIAYAIYTILKQKGTLYERFQKSFRPSKDWGPTDKACKEALRDPHTKDDMTLFQLFMYNIKGKTDVQHTTPCAGEEELSLYPRT